VSAGLANNKYDGTEFAFGFSKLETSASLRLYLVTWRVLGLYSKTQMWKIIIYFLFVPRTIYASRTYPLSFLTVRCVDALC